MSRSTRARFRRSAGASTDFSFVVTDRRHAAPSTARSSRDPSDDGRAGHAEGIEGRHVLLALIALLRRDVRRQRHLRLCRDDDLQRRRHLRSLPQGPELQRRRSQRRRAAGRAGLADRASTYDAKTGRLALSFVDKAAAPVTGLEHRRQSSAGRPPTRQDGTSSSRRPRPGSMTPAIDSAPGLWVCR